MPVDKHGSVKVLPPYLNFAITKAAVNFFSEILHANRGAIDMKHIKRDFCRFFMFFLSCVCYAFVRVCLYVFCGHLLGKG